MRRTKIISVLLLLAVMQASWAQSIGRKAFSTAGGTLTGGISQITFNIGETLIPSLSAGGNIITQGFEQPGEQLRTGSIAGSLCAGDNVSVPYTAIDLTGLNVVTAELSDASGSFASPVAIGTQAGNASGTIVATIPPLTVAGTAYRIRVVGSFPPTVGTDNGVNITINNSPQTWYLDFDGDLYSDGTTASACTPPANYYAAGALTATTGDCNDANPAINPGAIEVGDNNVDENCDGIDGVWNSATPGISSKAVSTAGGTLTGGISQITFNIGETLIPSLSAGGNIITQGFEQPIEQLRTGSITGPLCAGDNVSVPYTAIDFASLNMFTAELSDASGSFASPVAIGTQAGNASGSIVAIIPPLTAAGGAYRIRVVGSFPPTVGTDNGVNITINALQTWYLDADGDLYSDGTTASACTAPANYYAAGALTAITGDCNDGDAAINPGATEISGNGVDENCDGITAGCNNTLPIAVTDSVVNCTTSGFTATLTAPASGPGYSYLWYRNNIPMAGPHNITRSVNQTGNYKVAVSSTGCSFTTAGQYVNIVAAYLSPAGWVYTCPSVPVTIGLTNQVGGVITGYQWTNNNVDIGGATNPTYTTATAGQYRCRVTYLGGCQKTTLNNCYLRLYGPGLCPSKDEEAQLFGNNRLYPNPTSSSVIIELATATEEDAPLAVLDNTGRVVLEATVTAGTQQLQLDLNELSTGLYFIRIAGINETMRVSVVK